MNGFLDIRPSATHNPTDKEKTSVENKLRSDISVPSNIWDSNTW